MKYKGKNIEIIGSKILFGKETLWIRVLENNSFMQVLRSDLDEETGCDTASRMAYLRYVAIAARIKDEMSQKHLLAPYESSLIPLPHQILVLEKVMQSVQTRFLLADEVGMGKTIEAGLVIKEKKLRGDVKRILLIVPKSAMIQWQQELKEHFNEKFYIYNSDYITGMAQTFASFEAEEELNFWKQHNQIIVSTDSLKSMTQRQGWSKEKVDEYNKYRIEAVVDSDFDMVIIDEAHRMGGSTALVSRYQLADTLCSSVPNVLLLSATPHRGKSDHFRRVLQLIDANAFSGEGMPGIEEIEPYVMRSEKRYAVDYDGKKLFQKRSTYKMYVELDDNIHHLQKELYEHVTNYVKECFGRAQRKKNNSTGLVMIMFQKLASSSTAAIKSAMETRLLRLQNNESGDNIDDYDNEDVVGIDELNVDDYHVDLSNGRNNYGEEQQLQNLIEEAENCLANETDAKSSALIKKINELRNSEEELKVLVFTEFRKTQEYLDGVLSKSGFSTVCINGSMELDERQKALVKFKNDATVMIATDAAGESLNMQFCHVVFNYDLPWNPMTIEQRIGRVDRIGQKKPVGAYNMLTDNTVDSRVYDIIVEKLDIILNELGIDKTGDVLDSTIDMKKVNHLYLQSLLSPKRLDFDGDSWLYEIRGKLNNYKSTEGLLPTFKEKDIENEKASEIKFSPIPVWLEDLMDSYTLSVHGTITKKLGGITSYKIGEKDFELLFDSNLHGDNPGVELVTVQHPLVKKILDEVDGNSQTSIPTIKSKNGDETPGYLTLWKVTAKNINETKTTYCARHIADNGKVYGPYGNDLWSRIIQEKNSFNYIGESDSNIDFDENELLNDNLHVVFHKMETDIQKNLDIIARNKLKAMMFEADRIKRIGIMNIFESRIKKLNKEIDDWKTAFNGNRSVVPDVKHILTIRIDG